MYIFEDNYILSISFTLDNINKLNNFWHDRKLQNYIQDIKTTLKCGKKVRKVKIEGGNQWALLPMEFGERK